MRNPWFYLAALVILALAACTPATPAPTAVPTPQATTAPRADGAACTVTSLLPTPGPTEASLFPAVNAGDWVNGARNPVVTFLEYSDFQCPYCSQLAPELDQIVAKYPDQVAVVFRHYPLSMHDKALLSAQAAEAAGLEGKFWQMHDLLFAKQGEWAAQTPADFEAWVQKEAAGLGLDQAKFTTDMASEGIVKKALDAQQEGERIGIPGTPFMLINGKIYSGPRDAENLDAIVKLVELQERQFSECPPMTIDPAKQYLATIKTEKGDVVLQLYADKAPVAVNSFVFLARQGWYNGVTFHRVLPDFVAQAGDPTGTGFGGPGYAFEDEIDPDLKYDKPGVVGMANSGPGSNGSQFFITLQPAPNLDGTYTIFAQVVQGIDVVQKLTPRDPSQGIDLPPGDKILSVTISEK